MARRWKRYVGTSLFIVLALLIVGITLIGAGTVFGEGAELPGRIIAANLTPDKETGVGNATDDTIARSVREGIGHDGRALFPIMPYLNYHDMPDEDLASVIVYIRSLEPVRNPLPQTEIIFPVKYK